MFQEISLNYFKVPDSKYQETQLIAVLDASGSMTNYWQYVAKYYNELRKRVKLHCAITFDTKAKVFPQCDLTANINTYGGGGTNITIAFQELNKLLYSLKEKKNVTILFVSDGQGDYKEEFIDKTRPKVENLNFLCIGVGKGFPTFISMSLRQMYHNGDTQIPPLFLVSTLPNEDLNKGFADEILGAGEYLRHKCQVKITPCQPYPWSEMTDSVWAGSWVTSFGDELEADGQILKKEIIKADQVAQIGAYWLQNLQLLSLKTKVPQEAQIALKELSKLIQTKKQSFLQRVTNQKSIINDIVKELRFLATSQTLQQLDEATAAQRLKIGTQVGKFHSRALKFAGVSVEAFQTFKDEFIATIQNTKFVNHNFPASIITLQNQVDILTDPELIEGLQNCDTQYHLVSSLPIIGYGLYVKRSDASRINPYLVNVENIVKINKYIDSISIIDAPNHTVEYNIGGDEKEQINCLLPLYSHEIMKPFLSSNLFHIQMTFVLMENADTCFDNAYAALLGNALLFMINQEESQWKYEMIDLINSSYMLAYSQHEKQTYHMQFLLKDPIGSMADENIKNKTACEDISKTILALNQIKQNFTPEQLKNIVIHLIIEAICRIVKSSNNLFTQAIEIEKVDNQIIINDICNNFTEEQLEQLDTFDTLRQLIKQQTDQINLNHLVAPFQFNKDNLLNLINITKFNIGTLKKIYKYFLNEELPEDILLFAAYHSRIEKSYDRSQIEVEFNKEKILNDLLISRLIAEKREKLFESVFNILKSKSLNLLKKAKLQGTGKITRVERRRIRKAKERAIKIGIHFNIKQK